MAVPTSERETSYMQYVETARKLARMVFGFSNRLPKRLAQRLSNPLCNHATETYYHVQAANNVYIRNEADYQQRRYHLTEALGHLDHVGSLLDISYDVTDNPNDNVYTEFATVIALERKLIRGVMKKDSDVRRRRGGRE